MNKISFSSITNSIIRARKRTYIFTIIAIILCVFFCSTIVFISYGTYTSVVDKYQSRYGKYDALICNTNDMPLDDLLKNGVFSDYVVASTWGYAVTDKDYMGSGFSITKYDDKYLEIANKQLIEGRFPQNEGEIAIEQSVLGYIQLDASVGQTLSLTIAVPDGEGFVDDYIVKDFVLTGILKDQCIYLTKNRDDIKPVYFDFPAALVSQDEEMEVGGLYIDKCFGIYKDANSSTVTSISVDTDESSPFYKVYEKTILTYSNIGTFQTAMQDVESSQLFLTALFLAVLGLAFVFVSAVGISSAFSANLNQRKKQIGLLRAVGATKRQIFKVTFQEIAIISLLSIPIGILLSIAAIKIFSGYIGDMFDFTVNIPLFIIIILFSLICIILSVIRPMNTARKISPMQAIRDQQMSLKLKKKKIINKKAFVMEKHLSKRKSVLHKTHIAGVSILIALTVVVLLLGAGYSSIIIKSYIGYDYGHDYAVRTNLPYVPNEIIEYKYNAPGFTEIDKQDIFSVIGDGVVYTNKIVKINASCQFTEYLDIALGKEHCMQNPDGDEHEKYLQYKEDYDFENDFIIMSCMAVDDEIISGIEPFVYDGQIDIDKLNSGEQVIMFAPQSYGIQYHEGGYSTAPTREGMEFDEIYNNDTFIAGNWMDMTLLFSDEVGNAENDTITRIDNRVIIGAAAYFMRYFQPNGYFPFSYYYPSFIVLTTYEGFEALGYETSYNEMYAKLNYVPDENTKEYINTALTSIASRVQNTSYTSYIDATENDKLMLNRIISVEVTLLIIFAFMSIVMINNAVSAQIRSDKKTIGMLCALGASFSSIRKVYIYQIVHIIKIGLIIGTVISALLYTWTIAYDTNIIKEIEFIPAILSLIIYAALLIGICGASVYRKTQQIKLNSIVSNIRQL